MLIFKYTMHTISIFPGFQAEAGAPAVALPFRNTRPFKCLLVVITIFIIIFIVAGAVLIWYFVGEQYC